MDDNTALVLVALLFTVGIIFILAAMRKKKRFSLDVETRVGHIHASASDSDSPSTSLNKE